MADIQEIINSILEEYGVQKLEEIKEITPVRTGFLKDSFVLTTELESLTIENTAFYSGFVDRGTQFIAARNFTAPFYQDLSILQQRISTALAENISLTIKGNIESGINITGI
jgi:hypothetical protein